tara:strand:- start:2306 stop:2992 length:687 start_codon:yes stop_codon:yes gene_type:complete
MSIEYLNKSLKINGLTPTAKLVLVILANYADEKGSCYPSHKHIANMIGLKSKKSVQNYIKEFEKKNLLIIEHRRLDNGGYTSNRYTLTLDTTEPHPMETSDTRVGLQTSTNTKEDTKEDINYAKWIDYYFVKFWKNYKRKVGKHSAYKSFEKAIRDSLKGVDKKLKLNQVILTGSQITDAIEKFNKENLLTDLKYIPHASTWLNQKRWLDFENQSKDNKSTNKNNLAG